MIKLSIIVPIYGVEKYLRQCLDSIAAQAFRDFECILVDDGSKDGCPAICDEYADRDQRFKVVHKKNAGYGAAVNTGLDLAHGEWIGIVEPDDWIEPNMYSLLMQSATATEADVVKANFTNVFDDGRTSVGIVIPDGAPSSCFTIRDCPYFLGAHPSIWSCVLRKSFLNDHKLRVKEHPGAGWTDCLFMMRYMVAARKILFLNVPVYNYRTSIWDPIVKRGDCRLPVDRTSEIHEWMDSQHLPKEYYAALCTNREYVYLRFIREMCRQGIKKEYLDALQKIVSYWDVSIVNDKVLCNRPQRSANWWIKRWPRIWCLCYLHPILMLPFRVFDKLFIR